MIPRCRDHVPKIHDDGHHRYDDHLPLHANCPMFHDGYNHEDPDNNRDMDETVVPMTEY